MLRIANVSLPLDFSERDLLAIAAHKLRVPVSSIRSVSIARRSVSHLLTLMSSMKMRC